MSAKDLEQHCGYEEVGIRGECSIVNEDAAVHFRVPFGTGVKVVSAACLTWKTFWFPNYDAKMRQ
jgi:hypothetical protein